ncbi:uncharacterized protein LOC114721532 [Neltuma alba]|uniref:uncharacterized protein LOC114721532 n=1 Tax=Neltuma alba TaxID=207710 RepID=UPI0010A4F33F|nr:uncharacterized protein LOC114721532 [Prosopis alba]
MNLDGDVIGAIEELRRGVMRRDWGAVLRTMRGQPPYAELWLAKMNKWADTVLHAAIIYGTRPRTFDELFEEMPRREEDVVEILSARNQWGNTPLHCAAYRGSPLLCRRILHALPTDEQRTRALLVRNNEGETPLFLAAVHGHPAAFLLLYGYAEPAHATAPYVKPNGGSALHLTIQRKNFVIPIWPPDFAGQPDQPPTHEAPFGFSFLRSTTEKKRRHVFGGRIMEQLVDNDAFCDDLMEMELLGRDDDHPANLLMLGPSYQASLLRWTPLLRATKYGATEMVRAILEKRPFAIEDETDEKKNVMLVAVEERQSTLLEQFKKNPSIWNRKLHHASDVHGNTALHLVAMPSRHRLMDMSVLHLQWEISWFEYVKEMMPPEFIKRKNKEGKTPVMVFEEEHHDLVQKSNQWMKDIYGNYIVAATLMSGVTFGTCYQIPGGYDEGNGRPIVGNRYEFQIFVITALVSFGFSVISLAAFLAICSSQSDRPDPYRRHLPRTLCLGLSSLLCVSFWCMLISFYAAQTFELVGPIKKLSVYVPVYVGLALIPLYFYGATQFPLHRRLLKASFSRVPLSRGRGEEQEQER